MLAPTFFQYAFSMGIATGNKPSQAKIFDFCLLSQRESQAPRNDRSDERTKLLLHNQFKGAVDAGIVA